MTNKYGLLLAFALAGFAAQPAHADNYVTNFQPQAATDQSAGSQDGGNDEVAKDDTVATTPGFPSPEGPVSLEDPEI